MISWEICIARGKVSRRTRIRQFTAGNRQPFVAIPYLDIILLFLTCSMADSREQQSTGSACIGHDPSLERLKFGYMRGYVEKDDLPRLFVDTNPLWMQRRVRRGRQQTQPSWMISQIKDKQLIWRML